MLLELKYGHLRAGINKICGVLLCYEKFSLSAMPSGKEYFFGRHLGLFVSYL